MTEKQFKSYSLFKDKKTVYCQNKAYTTNEVVDLLNTQNQEIKKLETQIRRLQNQINKLPPKIKEVWLE